MSKITNDGLTRSGTGCFIAVPIWQQWRQRVNVIKKLLIALQTVLCFNATQHTVHSCR